jgi:hypothetical protein
MIDVQTISIVVASAGVLAGVAYYVLDIRHLRKLRQTESLLKLSPWFNMNAREVQEAITQVCSLEYKDYDEYLEKYSGKPENISLKILGNCFEGIGILARRKLVDVDVVYDLWGDIILSTWEDVKSLVSGMRVDSGPDLYKFWEYLSGEMEKRKNRSRE